LWVRKSCANEDVGHMLKAFDFCLPTRSTIVPVGPEWLHEVKYDGYRLRLERDGDRGRLIARGGYKLDRSVSLDRGVRAQETLQAITGKKMRPGALPDAELHLRSSELRTSGSVR